MLLFRLSRQRLVYARHRDASHCAPDVTEAHRVCRPKVFCVQTWLDPDSARRIPRGSAPKGHTTAVSDIPLSHLSAVHCFESHCTQTPMYIYRL